MVPEEYFATTIEPMYGWARHDASMPDKTFALYRGATAEEPVEGMFSFVPCLPTNGEPRGFVRPLLENDEVITRKLAQSVRLNRDVAPERIPDFWEWTAERVLDDGLALGTRIAMPQRSS